MVRPYWSGQVQISLVSFGVSLYVATESKSTITFHQISRSTGERVRQQRVLQSTADGGGEIAGDIVRKDEIVKGYEYTKGQYVIIEPSELENLRVPSKRSVAVTQFIDRNELEPEWIEKPYFVIPENDAQTEAFATVREALSKTGKVAIGKIAFSGREHVLAIAPSGRGMMAFTLRYQSELRDHRDYFRDIKEVEIGEDSLELAEALISKKSSRFDLSKFEDGYEIALKELVNAKVNHLAIPKDEEPAVQRGKVINLMDALRDSLGSQPELGKATKKPSTSTKAPVRKGMGIVKASVKVNKKQSA